MITLMIIITIRVVVVMMIKMRLIVAVAIIINSPFQPRDFSTGSTTGSLSRENIRLILIILHSVLDINALIGCQFNINTFGVVCRT